MAQSQRAATPTRGRIAPLPYAGLQLRTVAFILDLMVLISFGMLFAAIGLAVILVDSSVNDGNLTHWGTYGATAVGLTYALAFVPLYHILMWSWWGQTVGKMAVHIKVTRPDGDGLSLGRSALRLFALGLAMLPLFLGVLTALFDGRRRALHDHLAGTVVVEVP